MCGTQVHVVDELKQRLVKVWQGSGQSVLDDAMSEWHKRLWACVCSCQRRVSGRVCVHVKGGSLGVCVFMSNEGVLSM